MKIFCSNCGTENKSTNIKCEHCGNVINEVEEGQDIVDVQDYIEEYKKIHSELLTEEQKQANKKATKTFLTVFVIIFLIMFLVPFIMVGITFASFSSFTNEIKDEFLSEYVQIQANLIEYTEPNANGTYKGVYEYEVNGKKYTVNTSYASNVKSMFDEYVTVKYDPINPQNAIIDSDTGTKIFGNIGVSMLSFVVILIIVIIVIFVIIKRKSNNVKRV